MKVFSISYMAEDKSNIRILSNEICSPNWYTLVLDQLENSDKRNKEIKSFGESLNYLTKKNKNCLPLVKNTSPTSLLRFPLLFKSKELKVKFINSLNKEKIKISDWFGGVLTCSKNEYKDYFYILGDCPIAEDISNRVVGIPCNKRFRERYFLKKFDEVLKKLN